MRQKAFDLVDRTYKDIFISTRFGPYSYKDIFISRGFGDIHIKISLYGETHIFGKENFYGS